MLMKAFPLASDPLLQRPECLIRRQSFVRLERSFPFYPWLRLTTPAVGPAPAWLVVARRQVRPLYLQRRHDQAPTSQRPARVVRTIVRSRNDHERLTELQSPQCSFGKVA